MTEHQSLFYMPPPSRHRALLFKVRRFGPKGFVEEGQLCAEFLDTSEHNQNLKLFWMPSKHTIKRAGFHDLGKGNCRPLVGVSSFGHHGPGVAGNQPFHLDGATLVCNGEIYNHEALAAEYNLTLTSGSDCEVILHLYKTIGIERTVRALDGVFAFIIVDGGNCVHCPRPYWYSATLSGNQAGPERGG